MPEFSRGDIIAEAYEVVDHLGNSPLGTTYRVKQLRNGTYVQLTMLDPRVRNGPTSVEQAFETAHRLEHPHLCRARELGNHDGHPFYTYDDFEGTPLRDLLLEYRGRNRAFDVKEAAQICMQILEALTAVHSAATCFAHCGPNTCW